MEKKTDEQRRADLIAGLREAADFLENRPKVEIDMGWSESPVVELEYFTPDATDFKEKVRALGKAHKGGDGDYFNVEKRFGDGEVVVKVGTRRDAVCEKRVVGSRIVIEEVPEYDKAPTTKRERVVEDVEWTCPESILATVTS